MSTADFPSGAAVPAAHYATAAEAERAAAYLRRIGVPAGPMGPESRVSAGVGGDSLGQQFAVIVDADEWQLARDLLQDGPGLGLTGPDTAA